MKLEMRGRRITATSRGLPLPSSRKVLGEAVLFIQIQLHPGHHPYHRHMGQLLQLGQTGAEDLHVAPELVDDRPLHHGPLIRLQQGHGPVKGSKDTAPVDVPRQQHRGPAIRAMPMFTMSSAFRLISAGLPAPSSTTISWVWARAW